MRLRIVSLLLLAVCLITIALVGRGAGAAPPSRQLSFEDRRTERLLSIETEPGSPEAGRFSVRVPERGVFIGVERATLRATGVAIGVVIVQYDGDVELISGEETTRAPGRLQARLDLEHHTAEATLWFGPGNGGSDRSEPRSGERFHLVATAPSSAGVRGTAEEFRSAMLAGDWGAVYDVASSDLRGTAGRETFVASASAEEPERVLAVTIGRIGDPATHPLGFAFAAVSMSVLHEGPTGSRRQVAYDVYFVLEGPDWKLWFTVEQ